MPRIVSLKFRDAGKHYFFNALDFDLPNGARVVVETDRGRALATVVAPPEERPEDQTPGDLKSVLRIATEEDIAMAQANGAREQEAYLYCQDRIQKRTMEMKLVRAEYLFDGSKIIFYFTADGRVDFRELVKDLAHYFHTRIEMRQIGVRDEAKLIGGIGICGRELCCCTFLTEFTPVSVRMAKEQGLALNPTKISGQCGRLLCCLSYEFDTYCNLKKALPKRGRKEQ
jgi:cell fate regulator YaaT (PSP1 superfamily)